MAAVVNIYRYTGASPVGVAITGGNTRGATSDLASPTDVDFPIRIPQVGVNYSYWVTLRLVVETAPNGLINNLRWFTDGSNQLGTSVGAPSTSVGIIVAKASTGANNGYRQATGNPGITGTQLSQATHTGLDAAPVDAFNFTIDTPLVLVGATSGTGPVGDYVVYQFTVDATALPGTMIPESIWFQYDET